MPQRSLMKTPAFKASRNQRKMVEMRFAHLKSHHGFERLRLRGLASVRDEFHLAAIVRNLKNMVLRQLGPPRSPDRGLIDLIARAHLYLDQLTNDRNATLSDVAANYGTDPVEVSRILPLAYLAPRIVHVIMTGEQPVELTAQQLSRMSDLPVAWEDQIESLGL